MTFVFWNFVLFKKVIICRKMWFQILQSKQRNKKYFGSTYISIVFTKKWYQTGTNDLKLDVWQRFHYVSQVR